MKTYRLQALVGIQGLRIDIPAENYSLADQEAKKQIIKFYGYYDGVQYELWELKPKNNEQNQKKG